MTKSPVAGNDSRAMKRMIFLLSLMVFIFWGLIPLIIKDIYSNKILGAVFELLWLPMLALCFILPVASILMIFQKSNPSRILPVLSLLMNLATLVVMITTGKA